MGSNIKVFLAINVSAMEFFFVGFEERILKILEKPSISNKITEF